MSRRNGLENGFTVGLTGEGRVILIGAPARQRCSTGQWPTVLTLSRRNERIIEQETDEH